jgi:hypothetical protein
MIGLAVDTDVLEIATTIGASLGRHLADAALALLGWTTESLRAVKLTAPDTDGDWLPPLRDDSPRFPVAEHLRHDLLETAAQFLIAGAVRDLHDPTAKAATPPKPSTPPTSSSAPSPSAPGAAKSRVNSARS